MANLVEIEQSESVKTWMAFLDQTGSGSKATKVSYLFRLGQLCDDLCIEPDELLAKANEDLDKFERSIALWYSQKQRAKTRSEAFHIWAVLKSFLHHNGIMLRTKVKQPKPALRTALSKEELRKILDYSGVKLRAYIYVARDTGLAPVDILALRYNDVKADLEAGTVPCSITKRREKSDVLLHTFLGSEAVRALKTYLATKEVKDDSFLFTAFKNRPKPLEYKSLQDQFKRAAKQAGSGAQLYDLRKFFMTNLRAAGTNEVMIKYWSGHSLGVENGYTIPPIEQSREVYRQHYSALSFEEEKNLENLRKQQLQGFRREILLASGFFREDVEKLDLSVIDDEKFQSMVRERLLGAMVNNGAKQKVVGQEEVEKYVAQGWEFVAVLPNEKVVMKITP